MRKMFCRAYELILKMYSKCADRLVSKLVLLFISIIILIVVSLTLISYKIIENESIQGSITNNTNILRLVNMNFESYLSEIDQFSLPQLRYGAIISALLNETKDYSERSYLEDYMRELFYSRKDIEGIFLYLIEQKKYYYIQNEDSYKQVRSVSDEEIPKQAWFKKVMESKENRTIQSFLPPGDTGYPIDEKNCYMGYHRALINITTRKPLAIISFFYNSSTRDEILKDVPQIKGGHLLLLDSNNVPFYVDDEKFFNTLKESDLINNITKTGDRHLFIGSDRMNQYQAIYNISELNNWKLIKFIPYEEIYKAAQTSRNLSYLIGCILMIILSVLVIFFISNAVTKPLKRLSQKMDRFSEGYFDAVVEVSGRDEISQLSKQFNLMVKKMNDLINERYKMKLAEKSAILKALEAEINPHFLYNALQAIATKALKNGVTDISNMVDALALTFRYCISGADIVKLKDEIKHVENYLVLQKARFENRLKVVYYIEDLASEFEIPKLSIQALVENSIKHALEQTSIGITIVIRAYLEDSKAVITVKDNGPGISQDRLESIVQSFEDDWKQPGNNCIGLKNLNARLKIIFGDETRIIIKTDEAGTEISIIIPRGG